MKSPIYALSATLLTLSYLVLTPVQADIYKWVDSKGNTHYDQKPPAKEEKAKNVEAMKGLAIGKGINPPPAPKEPVAVKAEDMTLEQARAEGEKNQAKQAAYCEEQGKVLRQMVANPLVRLKEGDKEAKILTPQERTDKIAEIEKNISSLCNANLVAEGPVTTTPAVSTPASTGTSAALPVPSKNP